jgi:hypothetical protein
VELGGRLGPQAQEAIAQWAVDAQRQAFARWGRPRAPIARGIVEAVSRTLVVGETELIMDAAGPRGAALAPP